MGPVPWGLSIPHQGELHVLPHLIKLLLRLLELPYIPEGQCWVKGQRLEKGCADPTSDSLSPTPGCSSAAGQSLLSFFLPWPPLARCRRAPPLFLSQDLPGPSPPHSRLRDSESTRHLPWGAPGSPVSSGLSWALGSPPSLQTLARNPGSRPCPGNEAQPWGLGHSLFDKVVQLLSHRPLGLVKQNLGTEAGRGMLGVCPHRAPQSRPHLSPQ